MANKKFKFSIDGVANATMENETLNLSMPPGKNAYRLEGMRVQIDDFDAVADGDYVEFQFAYQEGSTFLTCDDENEIWTVQARFYISGTGTPAGTGNEYIKPSSQLREGGLFFLNGRDFVDVFFIKPKVYLKVYLHGQDAAETVHVELIGQYVRLKKEDLEVMSQGVTL